MNLHNTSLDRSWRVPAGHRFLRSIVRLGVWLFFPKIRLLNEEQFDSAGPVLLVVNYPESFFAALLLVAAVDRPVLCLLSSRNLRGVFQRFMARRLGIMPVDPLASDGYGWSDLLEGALANWGTIALFAGNSDMRGGEGPQDAGLVAKLVCEGLQKSAEQLPLALFPIHAFLPPDRRKSGLLIYVGAPIREEYSSPQPADESAEAPQRLSFATRIALQKNVFALEPAEIERFHHDLEDIAHEDMREEWAKFPDWKQQAEELQLSGFVKRWIHEQNQVNPGRLVALRKLLEDYREARRRCSLGSLRVETSSLWQKSGLQVAGAWVESVMGLPVAVYSFVNHIAAAAILYLAGLLKKSGNRDPKVEWLLRSFVVMGCYILQVWLFDLWLGRAAAGYYTLTLPLSGAYLWRYLWLAKNRSYLLLLKATLPARSARLRRTRKALLEKFEGEMNHFGQSLGMPS